LFRGLWRFIRGRTHRFVAVSGFIADFVAATGVARDRITVIYTRPTSRRVETGKETRQAGGFRFVFVGQISETKGVRVLIEAFRGLVAAHPDARLVIAGRISDWEGDAWARDLRDGVNADPVLAGRVDFAGFVEDVPTLLASCDVAVTPTITVEALANVVMEAKQAGLPSIIFRCGGLPEVIEHGADGYISEARTVDGLREALQFYLENRERAVLHGVAARKSLRKFGVDQFVEQWTRVVTRIDDGADL
jgi:glycosyltransferase involved in cell wall biosynthesis